VALYNETLYSGRSSDVGEHGIAWDTIIEQYEQPRRWHALHAVLSTLDRATWGLTTYGQPLDRLLQKLHERRCNDDCMTGPVWRRTNMDAEPMPLEDGYEAREKWQRDNGETSTETYCGRNPLEVAIAIRLVHLHMRERRTISRVPG
jgi:hypothetical protein